MAARTSDGRRRWPWRRRTGGGDRGLDPSRADLVVVASSRDDAEASSAALERASATEPRWRPSEQVVLRHHLLLPADQVADAVAVAAQDGYQPGGASQHAGSSDTPDTSGEVTHIEVRDAQALVLQRVQVLEALGCSQERSRMAGLAQRRGGVALGWDALQPPLDR